MLPQQRTINRQQRTDLSMIQRQNVSQQAQSKVADKSVKTKGTLVHKFLETKTQPNIGNFAVQDIFAQVDEALQKRKTTNILLLNEVMDCEKQLSYLQQQTKEQCNVNSIESVAISVAESNLDKLDEDLNGFFCNTVKSAKDSNNFLLEAVSESKQRLPNLLSLFSDLYLFHFQRKRSLSQS